MSLLVAGEEDQFSLINENHKLTNVYSSKQININWNWYRHTQLYICNFTCYWTWAVPMHAAAKVKCSWTF